MFAASFIILANLTVVANADGYRVLAPPKRAQYAPVDALAPVGMSLGSGVMSKNGKPHFWIGNGDTDASSQQGHTGVWLAWLQGADAVTLNHGMKVNAKMAADGVAEVWSEPDYAIQSWRREAVRLGLLCDFFHSHEPDTSGQTLTPEAFRISQNVPALHEIYYHLGHHLGFDTGSDEGLLLSLTHRSALYEYLRDEPDTSYMEIAREPGLNPSNQRVRRDFIAWARRKYGDSLATADAVWDMKHTSWDAVIPPPLDKERFPAKASYEDIMVRNRARAEAPNFYADWFSFLQDDATRMMEREIGELRRRAPWATTTVDVRGHTNRDDAYAAFVPERISPLVDIFSIHYGTQLFDYGGHPWDRASVLAASAAPLLWQSYFRVNTAGAIVNSENIFGDARAPMADVDRMRENDMGQLCGAKWRIAKDAGDEKSKGWTDPKFDDSGWDEIAVPGCWDREKRTAYEGFQGTCWLRRTFHVSAARRLDFEDGSRVFRLVGRGVAQQGDVWLNGHKLNEKKVVGWDSPYSFDVGAFLNWGGTNVLVWRVEGMGKSDNGLRFPSYVLADDQLSKRVPFDERLCRFMSFGHLMGGLSGIWMWHWHRDGVRAYMPRLKAQLNAVAEVALPEIRNRRGRVAYLYAYNNGPGLPFGGDERHYVDYYDALVFSGAAPDVFGEERFRNDVTPDKYPVLFVPMAPCVDVATYRHFKEYVTGGGTAIVTDGTFLKTPDAYAPTDFEDWLKAGKFGRGRVVKMSSKAELSDLLASVKDFVPTPEIAVSFGESKEVPLVERTLVGGNDRKVLYLANWGGLPQRAKVTLPEGLKDWKLKPVVGNFRWSDGSRRTIETEIPSQDVVAAVFVRLDTPDPAFPKVSPLRQELLDELSEIVEAAHATPCEEADVVFVGAFAEPRDGRVQGIEKHPEVVRELKRMGLSFSEISVKELKKSDLKSAKIVLLFEGNSNAGVKADARNDGPMNDILEEYVRGGGSLLVMADTAGSRNCDAFSLGKLARRFGIYTRGPAEPNPASAVFGDPFQSLSTDIPKSPLSDGVGSVLLYKLRPLFAQDARKMPKGVSAFPVVKTSDGSAMIAGTCDGGRFVFSSDLSMFAPLRIGYGDNAALLANVLRWLVGRPVDAASRTTCKKNLFLTEDVVRRINADEFK